MRRAWGVMLFLGGCGSGPSPIVPPTPDASDGWTVLASTTWSLPKMTEIYLCVRVTVDRDLYVGGYEPIAPLGTHHSVLGIAKPGQPDGVTACSGLVIEPSILFGSGVGTQRMEMPAGVGTKLAQGQQILLNLHLFNTSDAQLTGTSGVRIKEIDPATLTNEADAMLVGPVGFTVGTGLSTVDGACTLFKDQTIFAVGPHMHKLGRHMTAQIGTTMLLDRAYDFDDQSFALVSVAARPFDKITTVCSYENDTGAPVPFGQSTNDEMCFLIVYRYPAGGPFSICSN
jgi:hypothetical protein